MICQCDSAPISASWCVALATVSPHEGTSDGEMRVIVWVNGAFGSGKSTLVDELRPRWPEALVYDLAGGGCSGRAPFPSGQ